MAHVNFSVAPGSQPPMIMRCQLDPSGKWVAKFDGELNRVAGYHQDPLAAAEALLRSQGMLPLKGHWHYLHEYRTTGPEERLFVRRICIFNSGGIFIAEFENDGISGFHSAKSSFDALEKFIQIYGLPSLQDGRWTFSNNGAPGAPTFGWLSPRTGAAMQSRGRQKCPDCRGSGNYVGFLAIETCRLCKGLGEVETVTTSSGSPFAGPVSATISD